MNTPALRSSLSLVLLMSGWGALAAAPAVHGPEASVQPVFSPDGQRIAFVSMLTNLVANDSNGRVADVFLLNLKSGQAELVSVNADGAGSGDGPSSAPRFAAGGTLLLFESRAENLVTNDANGRLDIFVRELAATRTTLLTTNVAGMGANGDSFHARASADGRWVVFQSRATNLTATSDGNGRDDVFLRDRESGVTVFVSTNRSRIPTANGAVDPLITADGGQVVFRSTSTDLVVSPTSGYSTDLYARRTSDGHVQMIRGVTNGTLRSYATVNPVVARVTNQVACILNGGRSFGSPLGTIRFDLASGSVVGGGYGFTTNVSGHRVSSLAGPEMSADGSILVTEGMTGTVGSSANRGVFLWRPEIADPLELTVDSLPRTLLSFLHSPIISADGSRIAALHTSGVLLVFNVDGSLAAGPFPADDWSAPALSDDGRLLAFHTLLDPGAGAAASQALFIVDLSIGPLQLTIQPAGDAVELRWTGGVGAVLESATFPGSGWQAVEGVTGSPAVLPRGDTFRAYRLRQP